MKLKKGISIFIILIALIFASCSKDTDNAMGMNNNQNTNLTKNVVGTYNGDLTNSSTNNSSSANTVISRVNDYTVQVHCISQDMDTTFMLDLYSNGNMMMVCNNGDDFTNEYGHSQTNSHDMMQNEDCMDWNEHMSSDHNDGDQHYGGFDMDKGEFDYTFNMNSSSNTYTRQFSGVKK